MFIQKQIYKNWERMLLTLLQNQVKKLIFAFDKSRINVNNIAPKRLIKNILLPHGCKKTKEKKWSSKIIQKRQKKNRKECRTGSINRKYIKCTYLQTYSR